MEKKYIMYKTSGYGAEKIDKVEVVKETPKQVVYLSEGFNGKKYERRCAKSGNYENFFNSWKAAHDYLVEKAERSVGNAKERLQGAKSYLGQIKSMKDS
jgi:hypothetical protein